jgi:ornithine carbamoyltransferase
MILMLAGNLKREQKSGKSRPFLRGKMLGMIFQNRRLELESVLKLACTS